GRDRSSAPRRCDRAHLSADQIGRQFREPIESIARQAIFDRDVLALDVPGFGKTPAERIQEMPTRSELQGAEKSDHRHRRLLRTRRERPTGRRAAEQRDELAAPHSITSSVRASTGIGISRPSALAVLRLMTSSNLVANWISRSPGFSPLSMRSTYSAARR